MEFAAGLVGIDRRAPVLRAGHPTPPEPVRLVENVPQERKRHVGGEASEPGGGRRHRRERPVRTALEHREVQRGKQDREQVLTHGRDLGFD